MCVGALGTIFGIGYLYNNLKTNGSAQVTVSADGGLDISEERRREARFVPIRNEIQEVYLTNLMYHKQGNNLRFLVF